LSTKGETHRPAHQVEQQSRERQLASRAVRLR